MIRVVLDTNILISAILSPGGPAARILGYEREDKVELAFSPGTIKEVFLVLRSSKIKALLKKRGVSLRKVESFLKGLINSSVRTSGSVEIGDRARQILCGHRRRQWLSRPGGPTAPPTICFWRALWKPKPILLFPAMLTLTS